MSWHYYKDQFSSFDVLSYFCHNYHRKGCDKINSTVFRTGFKQRVVWSQNHEVDEDNKGNH